MAITNFRRIFPGRTNYISHEMVFTCCMTYTYNFKCLFNVQTKVCKSIALLEIQFLIFGLLDFHWWKTICYQKVLAAERVHWELSHAVAKDICNARQSFKNICIGWNNWFPKWVCKSVNCCKLPFSIGRCIHNS